MAGTRCASMATSIGVACAALSLAVRAATRAAACVAARAVEFSDPFGLFKSSNLNSDRIRLTLNFALAMFFVVVAFPRDAQAALGRKMDNPSLSPSAESLSQERLASDEIRVRLARLKGQISVSGLGLRIPGHSGRQSGLPSDRRVMSGFRALLIQWESTGRGFFRWIVSDRDSSEVVFSGLARSLEMSGQQIRVNLKPAPQRISFLPNAGSLDLIATLPMEEYLRGVLPSEMPSNWPLEALKAQAVAARSYAFHRKQARERAGAHFHVESTVMDQVFRTPVFGRDAPSDQSTKNVQRAINETTGVIIVDRHSAPLASFFHADCGGRTEDAALVWGGGESVGTAVDASCPMNPLARWSVQVSPDRVAERIRSLGRKASREAAGRGSTLTLAAARISSSAGGISASNEFGGLSASGGALVALDILDRSDSGRAKTVSARWSDGSVSAMSSHQFRMAMGFDLVRSTNFKLSRLASGDFAIEGVGYGHGVGLCQWGARRLADSGKSFSEILRHYYPKASLLRRSAPSARL